MSIFDIPPGLLEAIRQVQATSALPVGLDKTVELNVPDCEIGLDHSIRQLVEVFDGSFNQFAIPKQDHESIHRKFAVLNPHQALLDYTKSSRRVNSPLWDHHVEGKELPQDVHEAVRNIDASLPIRHDVAGLTLYSGLPKSPISDQYGFWGNDRSHKAFHVPAYISTSTDVNVAYRFSKVDTVTDHHESDHHGIVLPRATHLIQINMPEGNHQLGSLSKFSRVDRPENEILLGRGYELTIHARPTQIGHNPLNPVYLWHAHDARVAHDRKEFP